jgi:hypothetical protein
MKTQKNWMKQTMEESIRASLRKRISPGDLLDEQWLEFKEQFRPDDELWYFRSPPETWNEFFPRCGIEGYALVRADNVIAFILLSMS